jgi:hypothetical protein
MGLCLLDVAVGRARWFARSGSRGSDITGITYLTFQVYGVYDWSVDVEVNPSSRRYERVLLPPELTGVSWVVRKVFDLFKLNARKDYLDQDLESLPVGLQVALKRLADLVVATAYSWPYAYDRPPVEPLLTACNPRAAKVYRYVRVPEVIVFIYYSCRSHIGDIKLKVKLKESPSGYIDFNVEFHREPEE